MTASVNTIPANDSNSETGAGEQLQIPTLDDRKTDELVIAFVGPIGSGVSTSANILAEKLHSAYGYKVTPIHVSADILAKCAKLVDYGFDESSKDLSIRVPALQAIGKKIREAFSSSYVAEKCVELIAFDRAQCGYENREEGAKVALPRRTVHIIDSIKHPEEYELLKEVYGESFWCFGVFAPEQVRKDRVIAQGVSSDQIQAAFNIDEGSTGIHGQKVGQTMEQADFFIRNDDVNTERLGRVIDRYLDIIFSIGVNTPTRDESAMYTAIFAASSSACLSRQVGAAIYSASGELLGKGANDVPKKGGGLYNSEDGDKDHRCHKFGGKICHNDDRKDALYSSIIRELVDGGHMQPPTNENSVISSLKKTDVKNLIEYSRAVHAEMEAIISVGRVGKVGLVGSSLYSTTFPCHNCARHIVAAGVDRVIYIEPYPKSLATVLHTDAISVRSSDGPNKVVFLQYEGVSPKNMVRLFKPRGDRKSAGKLVTLDRKTAPPISRAPLDGFATREQIIVMRVDAAEKQRGTISEGEKHGSTGQR